MYIGDERKLFKFLKEEMKKWAFLLYHLLLQLRRIHKEHSLSKSIRTSETFHNLHNGVIVKGPVCTIL